jgi:hypothetical protein
MQIFLFHEEANEKAIQACEQIPIEKAEIIADNIIAVICELDALSFALATAFTFKSAEKDFPRYKLELLEASEKFGA